MFLLTKIRELHKLHIFCLVFMCVNFNGSFILYFLAARNQRLLAFLFAKAKKGTKIAFAAMLFTDLLQS